MKTILQLKGDGFQCTSAIILNSKKQILLGLRHYKNKWKGELPHSSLWTTPGGRADEGEPMESCLIRETREETGLEVVPLEYWGEFNTFRGVDKLHAFLCSYRGRLQNREPEKFEKWDWFKISEIPKNFINPYLHEFLLSKDL